MKKFFLIILLLLFAAVTINAQFFKQSDVDIYKNDVASQAKGLVKDHLDLTADQAKIFWPLYDKYAAESKEILDAELGVLEEYLMNYYTLSDQKAKELMHRSLELKKNKVELGEEYLEKMSKVLPPKLVGKFLQIENRIDMMIGQQRTEKVPLVRNQDKN